MYDAWTRGFYYDAGNFVGQSSGILLDEAVDLWNTFIAQLFDNPEAFKFRIGTKYGPVATAGNRS